MRAFQVRANAVVAIWCLLASSFASGAERQAAARAPEESPNALFVNAGKSVIVKSALPIERVSIGFGDVAEATAISPQEVLVNGKAPGETSLIIWQQGGGRLFFDVMVQPSRFVSTSKLDMLRREINRELPGQKIDVSVENDLVFLRGTVKDLTSVDRAVAIASAIAKPVNLLYVDVPPPEAQILLRVKFASVDRSTSNQLGINIFSTGATNTIGAITTGQFSPPLLSSGSSGGGSSSGGISGNNGVTATLSDALNIFLFRPDLNLGATIQALETKGLLEVLAEPNVLAENGKQASFLAGGEFPYPVVQGAGVGGNQRYHHPIPAVRCAPQFYSYHHATRNDQAAGCPGGERPRLCQWAHDTGLYGARRFYSKSKYRSRVGRRTKLCDRRAARQSRNANAQQNSLYRRHTDPREVLSIKVANQIEYGTDCYRYAAVSPPDTGWPPSARASVSGTVPAAEHREGNGDARPRRDRSCPCNAAHPNDTVRGSNEEPGARNAAGCELYYFCVWLIRPGAVIGIGNANGVSGCTGHASLEGRSLKLRQKPQKIRVRNVTRETVLAESADVASDSGARRKGLLGRNGLAPGQGLWIVPCESVHTFGMRFPVDVVYLDRKKGVRKLRRQMAPWRISMCLPAHSVLELPAGTIARSATRLGDQFDLISLD